MATLYHWDLPQALEDRGGWPSRETALRFADYARVVGDALGDRVSRWSTINEPWCAAMLGYGAGIHAPGRVDAAAAIAARHHLLLAHGLAVDALRATVAGAPEVAITLNPYPVVTVGDRDEDRDAARRVDGVANRLWYDAVLRGRYPDDVLEDFATVMPTSRTSAPATPRRSPGRSTRSASTTTAATTCGTGRRVRRPRHVELARLARRRARRAPGPKTAGGWAIEPEGLREALVRVHEEYDPPPLFVDEGGGAFDDEPGPDGAIARRRSDRLSRRAPAVGACRARRRVSICAASSSGPSSTTSSGPRVMRTASESCTWTSRRCARTPKASARWYAGVAAHGTLALPTG